MEDFWWAVSMATLRKVSIAALRPLAIGVLLALVILAIVFLSSWKI